MTSVRHALMAIADRIGRLLMMEVFPDDTAPVIPVSPIPPPIRIHRATDEPRPP